MISIAKVSRSLVAGLIAGAAGWVIFMALWALFPTHEPGAVGLRNSGYEQVFATIFGAILGLVLGFVEGINTGSHKQLVRACIAFTAAGLVGGFLGIFLGQIVFGTIESAGKGSGFGLLAFLSQLLARTLGWGLWGVLTGVALGVALGALTGSTRRLSLAAIGGAIGGLLGGFLFEILGHLGAVMSYPVQTLISFTCIAVSVAFFQSLAQELFKQAWIKVMVGRAEGREFQIAKPVTVIGKDELADIPLFGDPQIQRRHVVIEQKGAIYTASAASPQAAFSVNGQSVSQAPLKHGDVIRIASRELQFNTRGGRSARPLVAAGGAYAPSVPPPVAAPPGACAFCGQMKDAAGNCACSVGEAIPAATPAAIPAPTPTVSPAQTVQYPGQAPFQQPAQATQQIQSAAGGSTLHIIAGPATGREISLNEGQSMTFGRAPDADIAITPDTYMSRTHARFLMQNGQLVVQDLNSSNGTFVNGARAGQQALKSGDVVTLGQTQIRVS